MCVARKSGPGREYSIAVDWRDCAWSPRIVVQFPAAAHLEGVLPKLQKERGQPCPRNLVRPTDSDSWVMGNARTQRSALRDKTITRRNRIYI